MWQRSATGLKNVTIQSTKMSSVQRVPLFDWSQLDGTLLDLPSADYLELIGKHIQRNTGKESTRMAVKQVAMLDNIYN